MQLQALVLLPPLMHPVKLCLPCYTKFVFLCPIGLSSDTFVQMLSTGQLQGLVQYLTRLQHMHRCVWALPLLPPRVRCGWAQLLCLHMLTCVLEQPWHLEQQGLAQHPLVTEAQGP